MEVIDFLTDAAGDMSIKDGDIETGDATLQHQKDLMIAEKNEYNQSPSVGIGISKYVLDDSTADDLRTDVQSEFEKDGMKISSFTIKSLSDVNISADYGD